MMKFGLKDKNRTAGSNQQCGSLTFLVGTQGTVGADALGRVAFGRVAVGTQKTNQAALGVFLWFEVLDFDLLLTFFLCHSISLCLF